MQELISVIVPIYNCELYLEKCIKSIIEQSYKKLDIVLVDDGSTDSSGEICDAFQKKDSRINVIHTKNGGVSSARNEGIVKSKGQYVCFVDSDDYLPIDSVEKLFKEMISVDADYVAGVIRLSDKGIKCLYDNIIIQYDKNAKNLLDYLRQDGSRAPYGKMFKLTLIKEKGIRFDTNLKCLEDAVFIRTYLQYCNKVSIISDDVYVYNVSNEFSLSKKYYENYGKYYLNKMKTLSMLMDKLELTDLEKKQFLSERAIRGMRNTIFHHFKYQTDKKKRKKLLYISCKDLIPMISVEDVQDKKLNTWLKIYFKHIKAFPFGFERFYSQMYVEYYLYLVKMCLMKIIKKVFYE